MEAVTRLGRRSSCGDLNALENNSPIILLGKPMQLSIINIMSDKADTICERCGVPFKRDECHWAQTHCPECREYRETKLTEAETNAKEYLLGKAERERCPTCDGKGYLKGAGVKRTCAKCDGKGWYIYEWQVTESETYREEVRDRLPNDYDKKKGCFISSACIHARNLPDNCSELRLLRVFRDEFVLSTHRGKIDVAEYYHIAPYIVKVINERRNRVQIWEWVYKELVRRAVADIQRGECNRAYKHYKDTVHKLSRL